MSFDLDDRVFNGYASVELEIGPGSSIFMINSAREKPHVLFIAVEKNKKTCDIISANLEKMKDEYKNIVLVNSNARDFVPTLKNKLLSVVHIYFPSPYPHEERLLCPEFVSILKKKVRLSGKVNVITDHDGYYRQITAAFAKTGWHQLPWRRYNFAGNDSFVGTHCEDRYGPNFVMTFLKR